MLSAIYNKMYDHLRTLQVEDKTKHDAIVMQHPYGTDWISKVIDNVHLLVMLRFKPVMPNKINVLGAETQLFLSTSGRYQENVEGILDFCQNTHTYQENRLFYGCLVEQSLPDCSRSTT